MKTISKFLPTVLFFFLASAVLFFSSCEDDEVAPPDSLIPDSITIAQLNSGEYEGQTVVLLDVQFDEPEGTQFNGTDSNGNGNKTLEDCDGNTAIVFTATDKDFSNELIPRGRGPIVGVASRFGTTVQLLMRSIDDVAAMTQERCGALPDCEEKNGSFTNICHLRNLYNGGTTTVPDGTTIRGTVISDRTSDAWNPRGMVIQDGTAGISIFFSSTHSFDMGDVLEIDVSGATLDDFSDLVQIEDVAPTDANEVDTETPTPQIITIAQLNTGVYESQLITIENISYPDAGDDFYAGSGSGTNREISDGSNTGIVRIDADANYGSETIPSGTVSVTGVVSVFSGTSQLLPRNSDDLDLP